MTGWGTPAELINPATATGKFLDQMVKVGGWQSLSPWNVAQKVQGSPSSDGGIYRDSYQQATTIVEALEPTSASPAVLTTGEQTGTAAGTVAHVVGGTQGCGQSSASGGAGGSASWGGHQNGRIPSNALCTVPTAPSLQLECSAATAFGIFWCGRCANQ